MAILEALIILMIKSHGRAAPREQVLLIGLKQAIPNMFVKFGEATFECMQPHRKVRGI